MTSHNITTNLKKITLRTEIKKVQITTKFEGGQGPAGPSAYDTWLSLGNTGTEQDFIDSITNDCLIYTFAFSS